jgi:hypothetical protein
MVLGRYGNWRRLWIPYRLCDDPSDQSNVSTHPQHIRNSEGLRSNGYGNFLVQRSQIIPMVDIQRCRAYWKLRFQVKQVEMAKRHRHDQNIQKLLTCIKFISCTCYDSDLTFFKE